MGVKNREIPDKGRFMLFSQKAVMVLSVRS